MNLIYNQLTIDCYLFYYSSAFYSSSILDMGNLAKWSRSNSVRKNPPNLSMEGIFSLNFYF